MTPEQERKLDEVFDFIQKLKVGSAIPYDVEQAFRQRLLISAFTPLTTSSKGANSEDVSIDENGLSTHTVMADPAGFLQVTIANTIYYIPYFSS